MSIHDSTGMAHPKLRRGVVWCRECERSQAANAPGAMAHGWPKCCGYTMTIDSPEERAEQQEGDSHDD